MFNTEEKTIIAVNGHTNAGKTTLIRTLTKSHVGIIQDKAHATTVIETVKFDTMLAVFLDCPGFEVPDSCLTYLNAKKTFTPEKLKDLFTNIDHMQYDLEAMKGVDQADVVIYVVDTLREVPETAHDREIKLIKSSNQNIIGIGNKSRKEDSNHEQRIKQWEKFFQYHHINNYIMFDAWWDEPSKVTQIYSYIENSLSGKKKQRYRTNLEKFRNRQLGILREASNYMYDCILKCDAIKITEENIANDSSAKTRLTKEVRYEVKRLLDEFNKNVSGLYTLAAENPLLGVNDLNIRKSLYTNRKDVLTQGAAGTGIGAGIGSFVGGFIGFWIGLPAGGIGAGPAAAMGAQIGAGVAGLLGAGIGVASSQNNNLLLELDSSDIKNIATICLAIIWASSYYGYGKSPTIGEEEVSALIQDIKKFQDKKSIYWAGLSKEEMFKQCKQFFESIEAIP